ncbi:MAG TPA: hypothetical protein VEG38_17245, partial [Acidimicrobiia bacterium]|nr:hypothetical protein [Acidimicrobiia bacterium]
EGRAFLAAATKAEQRASLGITAAGEALALAVDAEAQRAALSLVPGVDVVEHVGFPKALAEHSFGAGELVRATGPDSVAGLPLSTLMAPILALTTQEGVLGALGFTTDAKSLRGSTFAQMRDFLSLQYADATQAAAGLSSAMVMSPIRTKEVVTAAVGALSASTNASLALKANRSVQITVSGGVLSGGGGLDGNVNINLDAAALNARIDQRLNTSSAMVAAAQAFGSFINDNPEAAAALATIGLIDTGPVTLARFGGGPGASDAELQAALQTAWELRRPVLWDRPGTILLRTQEYMDEAVSPADARNRWAEILDWQGTCRGRVGVERPSGFRRLNGDSFIRGVHQNPLIERSYDSEGVSEIVMTSATLTATSTAGRYLVRVALASDINAVQPDLQEGVGVSIQNPKPRANDEADRLANRFVAALAGPIIIDAWDEIGGLWVEGFVWMNTLVPAGVTIPIGVPMYFDSTGADDTVNRSRLVVYPCGWLFEGGWSGTAEEGAYRLEDAVLNRRDIMDSWVGSMADGCQIFATGSLSRIELEDNCGLAAGPEKVVRPVNGAHLRGYNLIAGGAGCLTTKETLYGQSGPRFDLVRSDIGASRNVAINLTDDSEMTATLGRVCGGGQEAISANRGTQVELGSMEIGYSARGLYAGNDSRISVDPDCVIEGNYQAMDADARGLIVAANGAPLQRDNAFERIPNIAVDGGLYTVGVDAVGHQPGEDARLGTRGGTVRFPLAGGAGIVFVVSDTDKDASIALTVDLVNPPADPARVLWRGQLARKGVGVLRRQSHPGYISASVAFENGLPYLYVVNDRNATFLVNVVTFGNLVAGPGETVQPSGATANIRAAGAAPYPGFTRAAGVGTIAVETTLDAGGVPVPHTFVVGQTVVVAGLDASVNGNQVVTAVLLPDRFQFANAGPDTTLGGGTVAHPTPPTITAQDRPSLDEEVLALAAGDLGLPVIQYTHPESMSADVAGGIVVTVGRSYFFPVFLNRAVDRIGVDVVANGAGAVRFGLRLNDNGKIGPLIL